MGKPPYEKPFQYEAELKAKLARQFELNNLLDLENQASKEEERYLHNPGCLLRQMWGNLLFITAGFFTLLISILLNLIDIPACPLLLLHPLKKRDSRYGYPNQDKCYCFFTYPYGKH